MKSLLRMAGKLLRLASSSTTEYHVLKSALKNFNLPRVITNDKPIFEMLVRICSLNYKSLLSQTKTTWKRLGSSSRTHNTSKNTGSITATKTTS